VKEGGAGTEEAGDDDRTLDVDIVELRVTLGEIDDAKPISKMPVQVVACSKQASRVQISAIFRARSESIGIIFLLRTSSLFTSENGMLGFRSSGVSLIEGLVERGAAGCQSTGAAECSTVEK
jgi:hypothetical protein